MEKPLVLVTGGAGFIGSNIVDGLLSTERYRVRVLDNFATGRRDNLAHCISEIEMIEGDIRDVETVEEAVNGVQMVLHQAALPSVPRSIKAPITTNEVNIGGTLKLMSAANRAGVRRIVLASSSSVYGDGVKLPKDETMKPSPLSPYAVSKLACEHYTKVFSEIYDMETLAIRYFNVFGPRQDPSSQYSGVIAKFMTAALNGEPFIVNGDGSQARDFTFVANVVRANLLALESSLLDGNAINVACGDRISLLDLIGHLVTLTGHDGSIVFQDSRPGDVRISQADIRQAREMLGYSPEVSFHEGLKLTLDWYKAQQVKSAKR